MADLTIREIYERHLNGDANTMADLLKAAQMFEELAWRANAAGPVFWLAANEAGRVARAMREFVSARAARSLPIPARTPQPPASNESPARGGRQG